MILVVSGSREMSMGRDWMSSEGESTFGILEPLLRGGGLESDQPPTPCGDELLRQVHLPCGTRGF